MRARRVFAIACVAWLVVAVLALISGPPLGHDEAAYAVAARGDAPTWNYRSTGMIAIARVGLVVGGSDIALRIVALLASMTILVGAFALGRAAFDNRVGAWAAVVLATAHQMMARSAELIGDLPATALLLGGVALVVGEFSQPRPRWRLVLAAPLFAGAFYIRYGSAPVIAMVAALIAVLYARKLICAPVLATAGLFLALLAPHVIHSLATTGRPLGILSASAAMPRRAYVGEGLVTYLTSNPFAFYGAIVAPVMVAGLLGGWRRITRAKLFVVALALGQFVSLGIESHGQPRYVFLATSLLVIAGIDALVQLDLPRPIRSVGVALTFLAWLGLAIAIVPWQHFLGRVRAPLYTAATAVRVDANGRPCAIAANVAPQLIWSTRCSVIIAKTLPKLDNPWPVGAIRYVVSAPHAAVSPQLLGDIAGPADVRELSVASDAARAWHLE